VQSDYQEGAAAMSIVLLALALAVLMTLTAVQRWGSRHER
jgi:ABC-type sulfate transport system permease component